MISYTISGWGDPIGLFEGSGQFLLDPDGNILDGQSTLEGLLGDQVFLAFEGILDGDGNITASVTIVGGRGTYEDATGHGDLQGQLVEATFAATWDGTIRYGAAQQHTDN